MKKNKRGINLKLAGIAGIVMVLLILTSQAAVSKDLSKPLDKKGITQENITKIDLSIGSSGNSKSMVANMGIPKKANIQLLKEPPKLTTEQIKYIQESINRTHLPGPMIATTKKPVGPNGNESSVQNFLKGKNNKLAGISAPGDFWIFQNSATGMGGSDINEPSVATNGNVVFYTGNWYDAISTDGGHTFSYISPYADMPTFCCDQDVIYDATRDIFIWYRQGDKQADGTNFFRMYILDSRGNFLWFWDFAPTSVDGTWTNQWFDYPQIALSNNNLIISSNMFDNNNDPRRCDGHECYTRSVLFRMPLDQLSTGAAFGYGFIPWTQGTFGLTSGDKDVIYWGTHNSNSQFRIFAWPENSGNFFWYDRNIDAWTQINKRGDASCPGPDNLNWCARSDSRVTGGWAANGFVGFFWNAEQGSGFNYPYIDSATFLISGIPPFIPPMLYWSRPYVWNGGFAFQYGNAYPNVRGDLGISLAWGGGIYYPNAAVGIADGYSGAPPPWSLVTTASGSVGSTAWGDYLRVRPYLPSSNIWVATGYSKPSIFSVDPRYIVFGRYQDIVIPLRDALDYSSNNYLGTWTTGGRGLWYGQTWTWNTGGSSAKSDTIANSQETNLQNTVNGPGTLYFTWLVSSEAGFDRLQFYIDGVFQNQISGTPPWEDKSYYIGPGSHTVTWKYIKDGSISSFADAGYVDNVRFAPGSITGITLSPNPMNYGGTSKVTVHVTDPDGNPLSGASVTMSTSGGSFSQVSGTTNSLGNFVPIYSPPSTTVTTNYNIHADASMSGFYSSLADRTITVRPRLSIATGVDNGELKWSTGGSKTWFGEDTTKYFNGGDAAQSGPITNSQNSYVQTSVTGPGILSFLWAAESENKHDFLRFYIDGVYKANRTGFANWQSKTYTITPGKHTLKWVYSKDGSGSVGYDAGWLDKVLYKSIVVSIPNGGQIWKRGTTHTIKWNFTDGPGPNVKIELYKGGVFNRLIKSSNPIGSGGHGSYNWPIPSSQTIGTNYRIRVTSTSNAIYKDTSDKDFTISS